MDETLLVTDVIDAAGPHAVPAHIAARLEPERCAASGITRLRAWLQPVGGMARILIHAHARDDAVEAVRRLGVDRSEEVRKMFVWENPGISALDATNEVCFAVSLNKERTKDVEVVLTALDAADYASILATAGFRRAGTWVQKTPDALYVNVHAMSVRPYPEAITAIVGGDFPLALWMQNRAATLVPAVELEGALVDPRVQEIAAWEASSDS